MVLRVKGSEGLVNVEGNTVGIGRKLGVYWVSKVAEATVGAAERRADIQHEWHIVRNKFKIERVSDMFQLSSM